MCAKFLKVLRVNLVMCSCYDIPLSSDILLNTSVNILGKIWKWKIYKIYKGD